ncbi:MAG: hypothetical protein ACXVX8_04525 [Blastococcus sp.]
MAVNVLDVRDTFAPSRARTPRVPALSIVPAAPTASSTVAPRRLPLTVLAAGAIGILEAVGLMATALTGIDGVLNSPLRPEGWLVVVGLLVLAAWIVLCAGSGAVLIDGAGRNLLVNLAYAEIALVVMLTVVASATPLFPTAPLPLPLLALLALAVPIGKLLLAGAPSAAQWVAEGPRVRERRADPVAAHRVLATVTLGVIGLALGAVAFLAPVHAGDAFPGTASSTAVFHG